jgi:hypothetical protein
MKTLIKFLSIIIFAIVVFLGGCSFFQDPPDPDLSWRVMSASSNRAFSTFELAIELRNLGGQEAREIAHRLLIRDETGSALMHRLDYAYCDLVTSLRPEKTAYINLVGTLPEAVPTAYELDLWYKNEHRRSMPSIFISGDFEIE